MTLRGKNALVTGAARGSALGLAELGGEPSGLGYELAGRAELELAAKEVEARGVRALALVCDVQSAAQTALAVERTARELAGLDLLLNNAGVVHSRPRSSPWFRSAASGRPKTSRRPCSTSRARRT
jgi:3-oxoacyl-[acyl-carrier protein] reductase